MIQFLKKKIVNIYIYMSSLNDNELQILRDAVDKVQKEASKEVVN